MNINNKYGSLDYEIIKRFKCFAKLNKIYNFDFIFYKLNKFYCFNV